MRVSIMSHHETHTSAHSKATSKDFATKIVPGNRINAGNDELEMDTLTTASFATGFAEADDRDCSQVVLAYGTMQASGDQAADRFSNAVTADEAELAGVLHDPSQSLHAMHIAPTAGKPVVIVTPQECTSPRSRITNYAQLPWNHLRHDLRMTPIGAAFNHENRVSGT
jgi:hypothetical protein